MSTVIDCPSCRRKLRVPEEFLGKSVRCPTCSETFDAVASAPEASPPAAAETDAAVAVEPSPLMTVPLKLELDEPAAAAAARRRGAAQGGPAAAPRAGTRGRGRRRPRRAAPATPVPPRLRAVPPLRRRHPPGAIVCPFCGLDLEEQGDGYTRRKPVRRDAEPHRGGTIQGLGIASLVLGVIYVFFWIGLPLGIAALVMARRDLRKMEEGVMDPNGRKRTRDGRLCAIVGTVLSSIVGAILLAVIFFTVLEASRPPQVQPNPPAWQNNPPAWQNNPPGRQKQAPPRPQGNNFTLRGPQQLTLKRGETKAVTITIDRVAGWRGNVTVAPEDTENLDGIDVDPDEVKTAGWQTTATFRIIADEDAKLGEQVIHFSATTAAEEEVTLDVRVNVVRGR